MKKVNLACLFMLWQFIAFAQTDTTGLLGAIQSTFSALNPSNIPTGILINRTLPMGNIPSYCKQNKRLPHAFGVWLQQNRTKVL
ncbi:MAG: hypothetical protein ACOYMA_04525 [Bacteroidia bacterium]